MSGTSKPSRVAGKLVPNFRGNAKGATKQQSNLPERDAVGDADKKGEAMSSPLSLPNNRANKPGATKSNYVRKSATVVPTALPFKRQPEGSVLTGKNASSGSVQPFSRGKAQTMSKVKKGGAD